MTWTTVKPNEKDEVNEVGALLRAQKASIQSALEKHFYWTDGSGASGGVPRLSSVTGSARVTYGTPFSSSATPGALLLQASIYQDLWTRYPVLTLLGSPSVLISQDSVTPTTAGYRWLVQSGDTTGSGTITFPTAYAVTPHIMVTVVSPPSVISAFEAKISTPSGTSFSVSVQDTTGAGSSHSNLYWRSIGTVALP